VSNKKYHAPRILLNGRKRQKMGRKKRLIPHPKKGRKGGYLWAVVREMAGGGTQNGRGRKNQNPAPRVCGGGGVTAANFAQVF